MSSNESIGTIYFDADCRFCQASVRRFGRPFIRRGYRFRALQSAEAQAALSLKPGELPDEVKLVTADGRILGGADMIIHLARFVWWGRPMYALGRIPGVLPVLRWLYRRFAANRHCISGACRIRPRERQASLFSARFSVRAETTDGTGDHRGPGGAR